MSVRRVTNSSVAKKIDVALKGLGSKVLKVGWVANKQYPDSSMTTAQVAAIAEYGAPGKNILPRPIIRPTIIREEKNWKTIIKAEAERAINGSQTGEGALNTLGNVAAGDMRKTITQIFAPPIKRATALARTRKHAKTIKIQKGDPNAKELRIKRKNQIKVQLSGDAIWKPLVDTGVLLGSCTFSVESE